MTPRIYKFLADNRGILIRQYYLMKKGNKIVNAPSSESGNERAGQVAISGQALQPLIPEIVGNLAISWVGILPQCFTVDSSYDGLITRQKTSISQPFCRRCRGHSCMIFGKRWPQEPGG